MYSYTQAHRLKKADDFSSVFNFRKVRHGVYFKIHYKPSDSANSRLGLVVSKKIHKRANQRNYMKRIIREIFRHEQTKWSSPVDIIVRVVKHFTHDELSIVMAEFQHLTKYFSNNV